MTSTAYTVTIVNRCKPYLQADGSSYVATPTSTVTTSQGQQFSGVTTNGTWFTPNVNVTTKMTTDVMQIASGGSAVCGCADAGQNWYAITIVGNKGLPIKPDGTATTINNSTGVNFRVTDFTQPFTTIFAAVGTVTYYTLTVSVSAGASNDVIVMVDMFVPPKGFDPWDPRALGPIYRIGTGSTSKPSPAPFTPGAVFTINTLNDIATDTSGKNPFLKFGTVVTATDAEGGLRTSPCYRESSDKPYQCMKNSDSAQGLVTSLPGSPQDLSDLFTLDTFTLPNGTMIMMLRNLKYGYLYVTNVPVLAFFNDPNNYNLGFDPTSKRDMKTKLLSNGNNLVAGQWTVIAVDKQVDPSTLWFNSGTEAACGKEVGIKEWGAFNNFGTSAPQTYYLLYKDKPDSPYVFFLQSGAGMWVNLQGTACAATYFESDGNIGEGDHAGRTPYTAWQRSYNPKSETYHEGNYYKTGCNNSRLPYVYDYNDNSPPELPMISNEDFAVSLSYTQIISTQPLYLPNGPYHVTGFPTSIQWWVWVKYQGCGPSGVPAGSTKHHWFYQSQAINTNFTFILAGPGDVDRMVAMDTSSYATGCYENIPFPVPYTLADSSAGKETCPSTALYGYPAPAQAACPAGITASALLKQLRSDPNNVQLAAKVSAAESAAMAAGCTFGSSVSLLNKPVDRISAASDFLYAVCGRSFINGEDGITCLDLATQTSSYCSGFRTTNYSNSCKIACAQSPADCNAAKSGFCSSFSNANDCACINITTSPFLNPLTNAVDASNQHMAVTYLDYTKGGHMEIETGQDAAGTCWWHPCVVDPIPALAIVDEEGNNNGCTAQQYMSCTAELDGGNISNTIGSSLLLYNSCYLAVLTGDSKPRYIPEKGTATTGAPSAPPPGKAPASGPGTAPPAKPGLSVGTVVGIVVGAVIGVLALAGILYLLFKPRLLSKAAELR